MINLARAIIYARCHNERSREGSIAQQVRACHELAEQHGWTVAAVFQDITGSARVAVLEREAVFMVNPADQVTDPSWAAREVDTMSEVGR